MKSELKRSKGPKPIIIGAVAGVLILGWASLCLPGRVPWLPYSLPASVTHTGDEVVVPVPSDSANGTQWRVETTLGSSPAADVSQLRVRYLSTTKVNSGKDIVVDSIKYRYIGLRRLTEGSTAVVLQRQ